MTRDIINARVAEIRSLAVLNPRDALAKERELWRDVLLWISNDFPTGENGGPPEFGHLAHTALKTEHITFPRPASL